MNIIVAITGATGSYAAKVLIEKSPWPVSLVASRYGREVYEYECGSFDKLAASTDKAFNNDDLWAPIASGSVATVGMIVLPCSTNTMAKIASGISDSLITRAAHCQLKERRRLILGVRETPWALNDIQNAERVAAAGGVVMPISPPYYMIAKRDPNKITMDELLRAYADRVLAILGHPLKEDWEAVS